MQSLYTADLDGMAMKVGDDDAGGLFTEVGRYKGAVLWTREMVALTASRADLSGRTSLGPVDDDAAGLVVDDGHATLPAGLRTDAFRSHQLSSTQPRHVPPVRTANIAVPY